MANVMKKHCISFELAQKMVDKAVAKARELGVSENGARPGGRSVAWKTDVWPQVSRGSLGERGS